MKRTTFLLVLGLIFVASSACSSSSGNEEEPTCVEALTECEVPVCVGNYVRSCSQDGLHYDYEPCYPRTCRDGSCVASNCTNPGERSCEPAMPNKVTICLDNMAQVTQQSCNSGTSCLRGACVAESCATGETQCAWKSVLTCNATGDGWDAADCEAGQTCDEATQACVDSNPFCVANPLGALCQDLGIRGQCDIHNALIDEACGTYEVCVDGFCQATVCSIDYSAKTEEDIVVDIVDIIEEIAEDIDTGPELPDLDLPPLMQPAKAWFTVIGGPFDEQKIEFSSGKQGLYIVDDADLMVTMVKSPFQAEVHFVGIMEKMVGNYNSEEPGDIQVAIMFNDGTQDPTAVQWKYASISYAATLQQFEDAGGRVIGTFSGTLEEQVAEGAEPTGVTIEISNGYFDVPRKL